MEKKVLLLAFSLLGFAASNRLILVRAWFVDRWFKW